MSLSLKESFFSVLFFIFKKFFFVFCSTIIFHCSLNIHITNCILNLFYIYNIYMEYIYMMSISNIRSLSLSIFFQLDKKRSFSSSFFFCFIFYYGKEICMIVFIKCLKKIKLHLKHKREKNDTFSLETNQFVINSFFC